MSDASSENSQDEEGSGRVVWPGSGNVPARRLGWDSDWSWRGAWRVKGAGDGQEETHQVYRHEEEMERSVEFAFATERLALQFVFVLVL